MSGQKITPPFHLHGLDHIVLRVRDVGLVKQFYCDVLGCSEERQIETLGLTQLRAGNSLLDLVDIELPLGRAGGAGPGENGRNVDHFCLHISPFNEQKIKKHLADFGIQSASAETRYGAQGYGPSIYITDPEGNTVELKG